MPRDTSRGPDGLLKSGLKIIGGKLGQKKESGRKRIYACEPEGVEYYIEPFIGSANVLVGKQKHRWEAVGDISPYNINFLRVMQSQPEELFAVLNTHIEKLKSDGGDYWLDLRKCPPENDKLALAAWYYAINKCSFNGIVRFNNKGECNATYCGTTKGRGLYDKTFFNKVFERIKDVEFVQCEYGHLLNFANGFRPYVEQLTNIRYPDPETTWVVLDPPYYEVFTKYDKEAFTVKNHEHLAEWLKSAKYRWLLTINDTPEVRNLYEGFQIIGHNIHYSCAQTAAGRGDSPELMITNYECKPPQSCELISNLSVVRATV